MAEKPFLKSVSAKLHSSCLTDNTAVSLLCSKPPMLAWEGGAGCKTGSFIYFSNSSSVWYLYKEEHGGRRKKERERQEPWKTELLPPQEGLEEGEGVSTRVEDLKDGGG